MSFFSVFPLYYMVCAATNKSVDVIRGRLIPGLNLIENFNNLVTMQDVGAAFMNSVKYTLLLTVLSMVICSLLEYITSYVMEKLFKARWWDYSDKRFNINGRICLETMIPFGIVSCLIIYIVNPFFVSILREVPGIVLTILFIVTSIIFIVDVITSFNVEGTSSELHE